MTTSPSSAEPPAGSGHPLAAKAASAPLTPGCYLWKDAEGRVIYVGKAKQLRRRLASYLQPGERHPPKTRRLVLEAVELEWIETDSEVEALLLENRLIKELQPRFNVMLKDGKDFPLLAITREEFPRVFVTRDRQLAGADLLGPFVNATELHRAYHFLQRTFRFRTCDLAIREDDPGRRRFAPCLNFHIKRCSAPCTTRIGREAYAHDIAALRALVTGRGGKAEVAGELRERMREAARALRFEDAAHLRDQLLALDALKERGRLSDWRDPAAPVIDLAAGIAALHAALGLAAPPRAIEGFDIAHQGGRNVVASLVRFANGVPHKDGYRRFKVRFDGSERNDDYAAMREVVARRYRRLRDEGQPFPDLVLIDGGHGQLASALAALADEGVVLPAIIGLAKSAETVVRPDGSELRLPRRDPGLKLLQYVRDEAHRFCRRYLHLLERQRQREGNVGSRKSEAGMGPSRKSEVGSRNATGRTTSRFPDAHPDVG